jgi:uncharacterized metal-binding protein
MSENFSSLALSSALGIAAILFGVFGFLYSVYAMYSSQVTEENPIRSPIIGPLQDFCKLLSLLIVLASVVAGISLVFLDLNLREWILGALLVAIVGITSYMSVNLAFRKMKY